MSNYTRKPLNEISLRLRLPDNVIQMIKMNLIHTLHVKELLGTCKPGSI